MITLWVYQLIIKDYSAIVYHTMYTYEKDNFDTFKNTVFDTCMDYGDYMYVPM